MAKQRRPPSVQRFRDPRPPARTKREGRDNGESVVYRRHQIAGDYKSNWERYQRARSLVSSAAQLDEGGYRVISTDENNLGYWQEGIITFYCASAPNFGRIFHLDVPPGRYRIVLRQDEGQTLFRFSEPPGECEDINTIPLQPIEAVPSIGGQIEFLLISNAPGHYCIGAGGESAGFVYLGLRLISIENFTITLEAST